MRGTIALALVAEPHLCCSVCLPARDWRPGDQVQDQLSMKNAKFNSKGVSFTANNLALVYLLDEAGARTTSDTFHDLHATNIVDTSFLQRCDGLQGSVSTSWQQLDRFRYWRTQVSCLLPLL